MVHCPPYTVDVVRKAVSSADGGALIVQHVVTSEQTAQLRSVLFPSFATVNELIVSSGA